MVSATAGSLPPGDVMSATAASSRSTPKHDRHGNVVSATAAQSPLGSVVSATAAHDQVRIDFDAPVGIVQSASNPVANLPYFNGEAIASNSTDGLEFPRETSRGLEPKPPGEV